MEKKLQHEEDVERAAVVLQGRDEGYRGDEAEDGGEVQWYEDHSGQFEISLNLLDVVCVERNYPLCDAIGDGHHGCDDAKDGEIVELVVSGGDVEL